jgi:hypothetical protein
MPLCPSSYLTMPTSAQYARYRADRTTIWVSKAAAAFLARERVGAQESVGAVLERLLTEVRRARRGATKPVKKATKVAKKAVKKVAKKALRRRK